jgi:hypothetical protein
MEGRYTLYHLCHKNLKKKKLNQYTQPIYEDQTDTIKNLNAQKPNVLDVGWTHLIHLEKLQNSIIMNLVPTNKSSK